MEVDEDPIPTKHESHESDKLSHQDYLNTLKVPTAAEIARISEIQVAKEEQISRKYCQHSAEEKDAVRLIQRAYRGHRDRRSLYGLTLDPSSRWSELMKEWRYRSATAPHHSGSCTPRTPHGLSRNPSDRAMVNWRRVTEIAERAGEGTSSCGSTSPAVSLSSRRSLGRRKSTQDAQELDSMLLDLRYFLEMVDHKHRYGANLQTYHEEWQRSKTNENFFYWLDHGEGRDADLIPLCSRDKLEREKTRYLSRDERHFYLARVDTEGLLRWDKSDELITTSSDQFQDSMHGIVPLGTDVPTFSDEDVKRQISADASFTSRLAAAGGVFKDALKAEPEPVYEKDTSSSSSSTCTTSPDAMLDDASHQLTTPSQKTKQKKQGKRAFRVSPATILNHLLRASVRPGTWIYVADTTGRLYVGIKSSGAFQHSSFLSGARISSAGTIRIEEGKLKYLSPLSGHYRPTTRSFRRFISNLKSQGVDTSSLKVSKAYSILLGMELYGTSKKATRHLLHPEREAKRGQARKDAARKNDLLHPLTLPASGDMSVTDTIEENWYRRATLENDKRGLAKLMEDLNIRRERRGSDLRRTSDNSRMMEVKGRHIGTQLT
ncbi:Putative IQ domain-containing protein IQM [Septoria linicola]|uniref:IQ domain-containing protein IQM n=1 Tax=Septoria linicola TaxID=215465 RepID=A0A9Q9EE01_9PEZI|nr:Putative IQ domain-containing protein IQM [Septoria linicola]